MQNLPTPEIYDKEISFMPWKTVLEDILKIVKSSPQNTNVLDLFCGPGFLLGKIKQIRPDLTLTGVDFEKEYIDFAQSKYEGINFIHADVANWRCTEQFDLILATAGMHHLPHEQQEAFVERVSKLIKPGGKVIIADPYIDDYTNETERKLASAKLGYEYLAVTIKNGADDDVIKAAIDVMTNDIFLVEYKNSVKKNRPIFEKYFSKVEQVKTWAEFESEYGDYYFILSNS